MVRNILPFTLGESRKFVKERIVLIIKEEMIDISHFHLHLTLSNIISPKS